ncbi:MAG: hypothetical protein HOO91_10565 [Bacteroidales bacterium]|nr:hypothetical protein [Bacteroidales bacterium]
MKFDEGIWYSFSISGIVDVPDKGEHFILLHESGRKMLLRTDYYVKYNFALGQIIECHVDKVNCTGQVFLEPKHPFYNDGEVYQFEIVKTFVEEDSPFNVTVTDLYGKNIDVWVSNLEVVKVKQTFPLKVNQVRKGIPILSEITAKTDEFVEPEPKREVKFTVKSIKRYNSDDYFILTDGKNFSKLKLKHFKKYGFGIGDEILCEIIGKESTNQLVIEPKNPWYTVGEVYKFDKVRIEEFIDLEGNISNIAVVFDNGGNKCGVPIANSYLDQIQSMKTISCKVVGFRKGRPQLEIDL